MQLTREVYQVTAEFPPPEKYGLASQMNRSVVSIPSNIAEGAGRNSNSELSQFLSIAVGSAFELETQILLTQELGFIPKDKANALLTKLSKIQKMLFSLKNKVT